MNGINEIAALPVPIQIILAFLVAIQLVLVAISLIVLLRLPSGRIADVPKGLWLIIILLGQSIGPIIFLFKAKQEIKAQAEREKLEATPASSHNSIQSTVEALYGENR